MILSQYALAEVSYATDTVSLSLSDSWTDVSSIDQRVDAVFMNPDGLLLYIQADSFESQMSGSEQAESLREILNSADDQVLMAMLQYSFGQRLQELDSNPQIHTADMAAGLVGCYCTVNMDDTLVTFADAASSEEEWFMIMGNANSPAISNGPIGATELETLMADILGSMKLNRKQPRPSFLYPDNSAEAPAVAAERKPSETIVIGDVIDALGEENYRIAYEALKSGDVIQKGRRSDANRGIQQMLAAFGQKISVDGSVGSKTIAALNAVQEAFGMEKTNTLDLAGFEKLLPLLLISTDPDKADALVKDTMTDGEYQYMQACASMAQGKYYSARLTFQKSRYGD